jgi:hypothetical protein
MTGMTHSWSLAARSGFSARRLAVALLGVLCLAMPLLPERGHAQQAQPGVLLELFTSQGCSSCPPADALLADLASNQSEIIPLALHVDYWDYIGWKDTFADAAYTLRQKSYARAMQARTVYTPQMIVAGQDVIVGAKPMELVKHLQNHLMQGPQVGMSAQRNGNALSVVVDAIAGPAKGGYVVEMVRYLPKATVQVTRGENAGANLTHVNIVTRWERLAEWSGAAPFELNVSIDGEEPIVLIVQQAGFGPVLAASRIE